MRTVFTVCLLCLAISLSAQNQGLASGEPRPGWIDDVAPKYVVWFVGKSDWMTEDMSYLEAKSGALADVLTQFMFFNAAEVRNTITGNETKRGNNTKSVTESATHVTGMMGTAGLYQQAEWIGPDGTIYVLYIYPLYSHEFKPDMPSVFSNISLQKDRIYFIGNAVSPDSNMEALSRQAEQNARMQMLLWLGGSLANEYKEYEKYDGDYNFLEPSSFEASLRFTSQLNQQALSLRQDHSIAQKETDLSYHYYGLYSISSTVTPGRSPAYEFFTYYARSTATQTANNVSISANFNGNRYRREIFPARSSVTNDEWPEWVDDFPPEDVLWGIGTAVTKSLVVQNLEAQVHAVVDIARQISTTLKATMTQDDDLMLEETNSVMETDVDTSNVKKRRDTVTSDGITWHLWEYPKSELLILNDAEKRYPEFNTEEALRLMDEQLNNSKK
jgi:hypothetical protein